MLVVRIDENTSMCFLTPGQESNENIEQLSAAMGSSTLVVDTPKSRRQRGKIHCGRGMLRSKHLLIGEEGIG